MKEQAGESFESQKIFNMGLFLGHEIADCVGEQNLRYRRHEVNEMKGFGLLTDPNFGLEIMFYVGDQYPTILVAFEDRVGVESRNLVYKILGKVSGCVDEDIKINSNGAVFDKDNFLTKNSLLPEKDIEGVLSEIRMLNGVLPLVNENKQEQAV